MSTQETRDLLKKRQASLLILSDYKELIERLAKPDHGETPPKMPRTVLGAICCHLSADFDIFLGGNVKGEPQPPAGTVEVSDDKRQQFGLEIYCPDNANVRAWLESRLEEILDGAIELHRNEIHGQVGGMHVNKLHRVQAVIEYPDPMPEPCKSCPERGGDVTPCSEVSPPSGCREAIARYNGPHYSAEFEPQAWMNDHAVPVDPQGSTGWDCTQFVRDNPSSFDAETLKKIKDENGGWIDRDDVLKADPAAPAWIREWQGPFTITVREL